MVALSTTAEVDAYCDHAGMKPGHPLRAALVAVAEAAGMAREAAEATAAGARGLTPEGEHVLVERVATVAAGAVQMAALRVVRGATGRAVLAAGAGIAVLVLAAGGGGYLLGNRGATITLQTRPGEIAAVCRADAVQQAPDGSGRICAVWVRLDQAGLMGVGK